MKDDLHAPGWGSLYLVGLSLFAEALAFLTLGLIQPWGEIWPRWIPFVRGRRVPVLAVVMPASMGAAAMTTIGVLGAFTWNANNDTDGAPTGAALAVMTGAYLPLLAWGPLLGAVTVHYYRRRRAVR
jgi:hypothetical protein